MSEVSGLYKEFLKSRKGMLYTGPRSWRNFAGRCLHGITRHPKTATLLGLSVLFPASVMNPALAPLAFPSLAGGVIGSIAKADEKVAREFLMNVAIRKSNAFKDFLTKKGVPSKTQEEAIEYCLKKSAPILGGFKEFKKEMPDAAKRILQATADADLPYYKTPGVLRNERMQQLFVKRGTDKGIIQAFKNVITGEERIVRKMAEEQLAKEGIILSSQKNVTRSIADLASDVSMKKLMQEAGERTVHAAPKMTQTATAEIAQQVAKTAVQETGEKTASSTIKAAMKEGGEKATQMVQTGTRLPLGKKLVEKIGNETLKKTGAKLATLTTLKIGAKKIPILGAVLGAAFATGRAIKGDWTGAGMEFSSGVVSCVPGFGTVASLGIDGALLARDLKGCR